MQAIYILKNKLWVVDQAHSFLRQKKTISATLPDDISCVNLISVYLICRSIPRVGL